MNWTGLNTLKFQKIISMYRWLIQQNLWVLVHFFFLTQQNAWHKARNQAGRGAPLRSLTRRWLVNDLSGLPWPSWLLALCRACALSKKKWTWSVDFVLWRHLGTRKLQFPPFLWSESFFAAIATFTFFAVMVTFTFFASMMTFTFFSYDDQNHPHHCACSQTGRSAGAF